MNPVAVGTLHHVELWVPDLHRACARWRWPLGQLGYRPFQDLATGRSWRLDDTYSVLERTPDVAAGAHDRHRPGLNHLGFHAGGPEHYAAYLPNGDGYEVEPVADDA
ncbi:hypothetical protein BH20ACT5_BH20ACT5_01550 [soil metagenome]